MDLWLLQYLMMKLKFTNKQSVMPDFVEKAEFKTIIQLSTLDHLTGSDDSIVSEMVAEAVAEMKCYLASRYETVTIFSAVAEERNKTIVMYLKDMVLYHICSRKHAMVMPIIRAKRYEAALAWLKAVQAQEINPVNLNQTIAIVKNGSNNKRNNHQE